MKVYLNKIEGIADAIVSLYMSKRTWTREKELEIRDLCDRVLNADGSMKAVQSMATLTEFDKLFNRTLKIGTKHITLLRFIDFSFTVEGLHRAGQDDFDSHAKRFENRIVRSSTRLADFNGTEKSEWYQGKVLHMEDLMNFFQYPEEIEYGGDTYVYATNGYIRKDLANDRDVKRGLYTLDIPSNFIFKINLTELAHVVKERDKNSSANPEVKLLTEQIKQLIEKAHVRLNEELLYNIKN